MQQHLVGQPVYSRLVTNGFSMSGTALPGQRYMRYFAYWPMLLHDGPLRRGLVLLRRRRHRRRDARHSSSKRSMSPRSPRRRRDERRDYPPAPHRCDDPRVRLHFEDGRFLLETTRRAVRSDHRRAAAAAHAGNGEHLHARVLSARARSARTRAGRHLLVPVAARSRHRRRHVVRAFCDVFTDCSCGTPRRST